MPSFPIKIAPQIDNKIYSWGSDGSEIGIDINQFLLFFKRKQISDFSNLEEFQPLNDITKKVHTIIYSFSNFPIDLTHVNLWDLIPRQIADEYNLIGERFYTKVLTLLSEEVGNDQDFNKIQDFFDNQFDKNILSKFISGVNFAGNKLPTIFLFAENFRFKSDPDGFNLFNLPKDKRIDFHPLEKDHLIFMVDFRQFEFRTFLDIQGIHQYFNGNNLYEDLGTSLNMDAADLKTSIIAYLYGSKFDSNLEKFFKKLDLIEKTSKSSIFWHDEFPIFTGKNVEPGKKIHTVCQTISQFRYINKAKKIFELLENRKTKFIYPFHDAMVFSIAKDEIDLIDDIVKILEDEIYKVKCYLGENLLESEEI